MIVITLSNCPISLRGDLTLWLQEISTNVYVGQVSARVRDEIWRRIQENAKSGQATMVFSAQNEQRMDFRVHNNNWEPIDFDGLKLVLHPSQERIRQRYNVKMGFSKAAIFRNKRKSEKTISTPDEYIVVDLETTGLSPGEHEIIEIGALYIQRHEVKEEFHALVKPTKAIPSHIIALTGITEEELAASGKDIAEILPSFLKFITDKVLVSHNANFDFQFLRAACKKSDLPLLSNHLIDTLKLSKSLVTDIHSYTLSGLMKHFDISHSETHRSVNDCHATRQLFEKLIEKQQSTS